jgi:hypothetical protein
MLKHAITGEQVKAILVEHGYTPNPDPFVSPHPLEENEERAWIDVNSLAVRQGTGKDEVPDYPIRISFQKLQHPLYVDFVVESVKELTTEEAAKSKALGRKPDEKKKFGAWPQKEKGNASTTDNPMRS